MDIIKNFRKNVFMNSPYFNFYNVKGNTVLRGILKEIGYRYAIELPQEKLTEVNKTYRKMNTILNSLVAVELILYIYLVIFPFFTEFMKMPVIAVVILLSLIPLMCLYLTYIIVNYIYESYLAKYIGTFQKVKFQPDLSKIDEAQYEQYKKTSRKSSYLMALIALIFFGYVCTPLILNSMLDAGKYKGASNLASAYLRFVPINPEVYAQRAYAKYKLEDFKSAVSDFEKANKYSFSDSFDNDILGVKTNYLDKAQMLKEFENAINSEEDKVVRTYIMAEKAEYLLRQKEYKAALDIYNTLLGAYRKGEKVSYPAEVVYYYRSLIKNASGDAAGAKADYAVASRMCPECEFSKMKILKVRKP